VTHCFLAP